MAARRMVEAAITQAGGSSQATAIRCPLRFRRYSDQCCCCIRWHGDQGRCDVLIAGLGDGWTRPDAMPCPADRVNRQFRAPRRRPTLSISNASKFTTFGVAS
jgi:hypothetical protein